MGHNQEGYSNLRKASLLVIIHWIVEHKGRTDSAILVWNNSYVQHLSQYFADGHVPTSSPGNTLHGVKRVRNFVKTAFFKICQPYFGNPVKKMYFDKILASHPFAAYSTFRPSSPVVAKLYGFVTRIFPSPNPNNPSPTNLTRALVNMSSNTTGKGRACNFAPQCWKSKWEWTCPNAVARRARVMATLRVACTRKSGYVATKECYGAQ